MWTAAARSEVWISKHPPPLWLGELPSKQSTAETRSTGEGPRALLFAASPIFVL